VTDVRPFPLVASLLAGASLACSSGVAAPPQGFSTAFAAASADGGAAPAFRAVRGAGAGYAWAVGDDGTAAELVGNNWAPIASSTTATLGGLSMAGSAPLAVELGGPHVVSWDGRQWAGVGADRADRAAAATFAFTPSDAWVAGNGIDHWDGQSWTQEVASGATYTSLFGSFRTDVWAVGPGGVQHYDGHAWSPVTPPSEAGALAAVWVSALWDAWFVGAKGTILHWDGKTLTSVPSNTTKDLTSVTGTSSVDVWAGGQDGTLLQWDGSSWVARMTPAGVGHAVSDVWKALDAAVLLVDDTGAVTQYVP
jgi:hypothetical protein